MKPSQWYTIYEHNNHEIVTSKDLLANLRLGSKKWIDRLKKLKEKNEKIKNQFDATHQELVANILMVSLDDATSETLKQIVRIRAHLLLKQAKEWRDKESLPIHGVAMFNY